MTVVQSLIAFALAAGLLTILPGPDTAQVLRTSAVGGARRGFMTVLGISIGCLTWGAASALGISALLAASKLAFTVMKWAGAAYLVWLGIGMLRKPRTSFDMGSGTVARGGFMRGLMTNLLNPKIGVFYISFLPQFTPAGVPVAPFMLLLAALHALIGAAWLSALVVATQSLRTLLQRPNVVRWLDRVTGLVFLGFGARLALAERP